MRVLEQRRSDQPEQPQQKVRWDDSTISGAVEGLYSDAMPTRFLPVLLDCDPGIDDAFALAYLASRDDVETVGVVTTAGNVGQDDVLRNALGLTELLGMDAPVARGADAPLVEPVMTAEETHGPRFGACPAGGLRTSPRWAQRCATVGGSCPEIPRRAGRHRHRAADEPRAGAAGRTGLAAVVAGAARHGWSDQHRGNTGPTSEWNIAVDPEAGHEVFEAWGKASKRVVLGALQATEVIRLDERDRRAVKELGEHPVVKVLADALRFYFEFHEADGLGWCAYLHDPLVVANAVTGRFATTRPLAVDVELTGTLTRGQTVGDELGRWGKEPNVDLLCEVDAEGFIEHLLTTLRTGLG
ncbi:inosine-uridine preferring nucleoside hydrolase [Cutibacterium acnes JCM 18920]|nr:inosine-uridine preferring nucleoside hydrolase [Cutibacterium acnes JCM 18920]